MSNWKNPWNSKKTSNAYLAGRSVAMQDARRGFVTRICKGDSEFWAQGVRDAHADLAHNYGPNWLKKMTVAS